MVKVNSALILYFTAFVLYMIAVIIGSDNLELFSKPIIIPSIYYFYYISVRGKINYLFSFSVWSFFIGEILHLISRDDFNISGLIFLLIPYFINCMSFYLPQVITANATLSKSLCLKYLRFNL